MFKKLLQSFPWKLLVALFLTSVALGVMWFEWQVVSFQADKIQKVEAELVAFQSEDQVQKNASLSALLTNIQETYEGGARLFEARAELDDPDEEIDLALAKYLSLLSTQKWEEAKSEEVKILSLVEKQVVASVPAPIPASAPVNNAPPGSGYSRQRVSTSRGEFVVALVVAPNARVVVETMDDPNCVGNCEARPLAEHVAKSGGFAGINGAYFCPPDYAQCQGKTNTFDTLAVNGRTKVVFNQANNVYSTIPLVAAYNTSLSFYDQTVQWGVDTSGGGAIANYPRLLRGGEVATTEENGKGTRGFIATKDDSIVIGHVFAASFADTAEVLKTLGLHNAMNLDGGGSSALWYEGSYKVGPGRLLPTAVVLVR